MDCGTLENNWWCQRSATFARLFFVWLMMCWDILVLTNNICLCANHTIGLRCDGIWNGPTYRPVSIVNAISPPLVVPWGPCTRYPSLTADVSLSRWIS